MCGECGVQMNNSGLGLHSTKAPQDVAPQSSTIPHLQASLEWTGQAVQQNFVSVLGHFCYFVRYKYELHLYLFVLQLLLVCGSLIFIFL
jgi:hypothetical protein